MRRALAVSSALYVCVGVCEWEVAYRFNGARSAEWPESSAPMPRLPYRPLTAVVIHTGGSCPLPAHPALRCSGTYSPVHSPISSTLLFRSGIINEPLHQAGFIWANLSLTKAVNIILVRNSALCIVYTLEAGWKLRGINLYMCRLLLLWKRYKVLT